MVEEKITIARSFKVSDYKYIVFHDDILPTALCDGVEFNEEQAEAYINSNIFLSIHYGDYLIGFVAFDYILPTLYRIHIGILEPYRHKKTEYIVGKAILWLSVEKKSPQILAQIRASLRNVISLAYKCNFTICGNIPKSVTHGGKTEDLILMAWKQ